MLKKYYQENKVPFTFSGRRFAVGDIHGCYKTFRSLLENKIELTQYDQLFLLGDYIHKGPRSKDTLNYILKLIKRGYKVFPLRGNHEDELLNASKRKDSMLLRWLCRKSSDLLKDGKVRKKHLDFIESLPYYYELHDFYLVHGGFNFAAVNPLKDKKAMLWRRMREDETDFGGIKRIIHAHQPQAFNLIQSRVQTRAKVIGLDNGVNYVKKHKLYEVSKMGNLCALNLDTFELIVQPNVENLLKNQSKQKRRTA